jgi:hypothetical protein
MVNDAYGPLALATVARLRAARAEIVTAYVSFLNISFLLRVLV